MLGGPCEGSRPRGPRKALSDVRSARALAASKLARPGPAAHSHIKMEIGMRPLWADIGGTKDERTGPPAAHDFSGASGPFGGKYSDFCDLVVLWPRQGPHPRRGGAGSENLLPQLGNQGRAEFSADVGGSGVTEGYCGGRGIRRCPHEWFVAGTSRVRGDCKTFVAGHDRETFPRPNSTPNQLQEGPREPTGKGHSGEPAPVAKNVASTRSTAKMLIGPGRVDRPTPIALEVKEITGAGTMRWFFFRSATISVRGTRGGDVDDGRWMPPPRYAHAGRAGASATRGASAATRARRFARLRGDIDERRGALRFARNR